MGLDGEPGLRDNYGMRWYPSKVDAWLAVVLGLAVVVTAGMVVVTPAEGRWISVGSLVFLLAVYGGLVFPMRYAISDEHLVVRHGLVRSRIPLREIEHVRPTRDPLSSPALSLDRLAIHWGPEGRRRVMISPADRSGFLAELASKAGLERDGDGLVRRRA